MTDIDPDARVPERSAVPPPVHGVLADERTTTTDGTVVVRDLVRAYGLGEGDGRVLRGLDLSIAAGRVRRDPRPQRLRQEHPAAGARRARPRRARHRHHRGAGPGVGGVPGLAAAAVGPGARQRDPRPARSAGVRELGIERLAEVGLAGRERAWPTELSGGEQQRVSLARSLVREPQLLLADEPFGALDALTRIRMHGLLRDLCARHEPAVLLVTHDVDEAIVLADRVIVLDAGRIALHVEVGIDGPRDTTDPRFADLRAQLLAALGVPLTERTPLMTDHRSRRPAPPQRLPHEHRPPRGVVAAAGERPVVHLDEHRLPAAARADRRARQARLDLLRRRPRAEPGRGPPPGGHAGADGRARRHRGGHGADRADRDRVHHLQRPVQPGPAVRVAGPHQRRPGRLERGDHGVRRGGAQLRARRAAGAPRALRAGGGVPGGRRSSCGTRGRTTPRSATRRRASGATRRASTRSVTSGSTSRWRAR